jgi:hypothetical protein
VKGESLCGGERMAGHESRDGNIDIVLLTARKIFGQRLKMDAVPFFEVRGNLIKALV